MAIGSMTTNSTVDLIDKTLTTENAPADAAAVGDIILDRTKETPQPIFYSKAAVDELLKKKLDLTGGTMKGLINFGNQLLGLKWDVSNGDYYAIVNEPSSSLFQIVRKPHDGEIYAPLNITGKGEVIMYTGGSGVFTIDNQQVETVVASGSNYVRFGDGTQICWGHIVFGKMEANSATLSRFVFAAPFFNTDYAIMSLQTGDVGGTNLLAVNLIDKTTTYANVSVYNSKDWANNAGVIHDCIAIGRWK